MAKRGSDADSRRFFDEFASVVDKLTRLRRPGETFSHVILRLAAMGYVSLNGS
jgi:hypothetical protein